jgi:hypothetical protein
LALFINPSWAQSCGEGEATTCHSFDPSAGNDTFTYNFSDGSSLTVQFETVLTTFDLRVGVSHPVDSTAPPCVEEPCPSPISLDPKEFPSGTVCAHYPTNGTGVCDQYDFTGNAGGPHGVPVKNKNYKGLITLTLSYDITGAAHNPAFGHAPGDITTFTEDILTSYFDDTFDPTMGGKTPGLSSVVALDEPFTEIGDVFCGLTQTPTNNPSEQKDQIEVTFKIVGPGSNCTTGTGLRDKTARLSVSTTVGGKITFPPIKNAEGNKFHWDNKNGLNEYDISLEGLPNGLYVVTVFSSKFSPRFTTFTLP